MRVHLPLKVKEMYNKEIKSVVFSWCVCTASRVCLFTVLKYLWLLLKPECYLIPGSFLI